MPKEDHDEKDLKSVLPSIQHYEKVTPKEDTIDNGRVEGLNVYELTYKEKENEKKLP